VTECHGERKGRFATNSGRIERINNLQNVQASIRVAWLTAVSVVERASSLSMVIFAPATAPQETAEVETSQVSLICVIGDLRYHRRRPSNFRRERQLSQTTTSSIQQPVCRTSDQSDWPRSSIYRDRDSHLTSSLHWFILSATATVIYILECTQTIICTSATQAKQVLF